MSLIESLKGLEIGLSGILNLSANIAIRRIKNKHRQNFTDGFNECRAVVPFQESIFLRCFKQIFTREATARDETDVRISVAGLPQECAQFISDLEKTRLVPVDGVQFVHNHNQLADP
jgi:hypothetical protein